MAQTAAGIFEFVFGAAASERDDLLKFWSVLGFEPDVAGSITSAQAAAAYQHESGLHSVRLRHAGCETYSTGFVRIQFWDQLRNEGLGDVKPIVTGSRWMGMYTRDILQLQDSFSSRQAKKDWQHWMSPLVAAPLANPPPEHDFYTQFVGLRELLVFGNRFRLAFIQRAGFDRPGFGTFDETAAFKNTEGSHANVVQPDNAFSTAFYKQAFDFEAAPFGEAHDSGGEPPTIAALNLNEGETFRIERTRAPDCPAGLLQVYSSYQSSIDHRDLSRPGSGNLCAYTVRVASLDALIRVIDATDGARRLDVFKNEFGEQSLLFFAPDGYAWIAVTDVV